MFQKHDHDDSPLRLTKQKDYKDEDKEDDDYLDRRSPTRKLSLRQTNKKSSPPKTPEKGSRQIDRKKSVANPAEGPQIHKTESKISLDNIKEYANEFSFQHIFQDLKKLEKENEPVDDSIMLDGNFDIKANDNFFNSDGYIEEEDDDIFTPEEEEVIGIRGKTIIDEILTTVDQLKTVLTSNKYEKQKFKIILKSQKFNDEVFSVISDDFMMTILKYLFDELNDPMLEFSDNCTEDRRKFFENNFGNYIKTIELYLKKKNEFFSCVLSNLFFKLTINQQDFDNSVNYYINLADESESVLKLRDQYEKVFNVGKKEM